MPLIGRVSPGLASMCLPLSRKAVYPLTRTCAAFAVFDARPVIHEVENRHHLGELRHAADVIRVVVRDQQVVDLLHARDLAAAWMRRASRLLKPPQPVSISIDSPDGETTKLPVLLPHRWSTLRDSGQNTGLGGSQEQNTGESHSHGEMLSCPQRGRRKHSRSVKRMDL